MRPQQQYCNSIPCETMSKQIIGVPVLPMPGGRSSIHSDVSSPSYRSEAPDVLSNATWTLQHVDFIPKLMKTKRDEDYESFKAVVERANIWASENKHCLIFTCETVTWTSIDKPLYTDNGLMQKSMHSDKKTKFYRGIRLWYLVLDDTFPDAEAAQNLMFITYKDYVPQSKNDTSHLLTKINEDVRGRQIKVSKVETLHLNQDAGDPEVTSWREQPDNSRDFVTFIRVFGFNTAAGNDATKAAPLLIRDFLPVFDQRSVHNQGYEVYGDLFKKASRWIFENPDCKPINFQSVFIKIKKGTDDLTSTLWERCSHKEHGSAHGSLRAEKTEYLQMLRVYYSKTEEPTAKKLFYKPFSPGKLNLPYVHEDIDQLESAFEDLRGVEQRINKWLAVSGAKVFNVETIATRLTTGGQDTLGPEATMTSNGRERNVAREYWKNNIRISIEGEFKS
ncbi:hypothetical protein CAPTEDRAFT_207195 [Capitella teleta]|uniref:Uncharacterized protein n=1 Tax=Capitella teleta TaxID=283909 RepID=R7TE41_CAPTE|nr:hypothetical protein CAPTEDRAFT_207195 [Capitella teleta]|eukprot:ELT89321.1 hypothetical protein CAPTEDRAFT_207195 [Capitella teleta]